MSRCRNVLRLLGAFLVGGALFAGAPSQAEATFTMTLQSGATTLIIADGDVNDQNSDVGEITYEGLLNGFNLIVNTGTSNSGTFDPAAQLTFNVQIQNVSSSDTSLILTLNDNGFTADVPVATTAHTELSLTSPLGTPGVTAQSTVAGQNTTLLSIAGSGGFVQADDNVSIPSSPYTITSVITFSLDQGEKGQFIGNTTVNTPVEGPSPVPAPGGLVLLASMLPFAWGFRRRLTRKDVAA